MNKIGYIVLIVVIIIVILALVGVFDGGTSTDNNRENTETEALNAPELYGGLEWDTDDSAQRVSLTYTDASGEFQQVEMEGTLRTAQVEAQELSEFSAAIEVMKDFYENRLGPNWTDGEVKFDNLTLSPVMADGPYSTVWGYLGRSDGLVRSIILAVELTGTDVSGGEGPIQYECPCTVDVGLFESDLVQLESLIN